MPVSLGKVHSAGEVEKLVEDIGLLPFFRCNVAGFSLQACTPPGRWFVEGVEGPWEWREQVAAGGKVAYGKLLGKKAGFVSMALYPDLCNYRRDGYDFDARYDDGLASRRCKLIVDALGKHGPLLSSELKLAAGFGKEGHRGFEGAITTLQMQTYVTIKEFVYKHDKFGRPYGWGVGRYALAEQVFGEALTTGRYAAPPEQSRQAIVAHLAGKLPGATVAELEKLIR